MTVRVIYAVGSWISMLRNFASEFYIYLLEMKLLYIGSEISFTHQFIQL